MNVPTEFRHYGSPAAALFPVIYIISAFLKRPAAAAAAAAA